MHLRCIAGDKVVGAFLAGAALAATAAALTKLRDVGLSLSRRRFDDDPMFESLALVLTTLSSLTHLSLHLDMSSQYVDTRVALTPGLEALVHSVGRLPQSLRALDMDGVPTCVMAAVPDLRGLTGLALNAISGDGLSAARRIIARAAPELRHLCWDFDASLASLGGEALRHLESVDVSGGGSADLEFIATCRRSSRRAGVTRIRTSGALCGEVVAALDRAGLRRAA